jgi:hypothetical protein
MFNFDIQQAITNRMFLVAAAVSLVLIVLASLRRS